VLEPHKDENIYLRPRQKITVRELANGSIHLALNEKALKPREILEQVPYLPEAGNATAPECCSFVSPRLVYLYPFFYIKSATFHCALTA
jgi:hypothetical protein